LAKIALAVQRALEQRRALGERGRTTARVLARGEGWSVADVVCTSGPLDQPFEEQHTHYSIAVVLAGTFQYRSRAGRAGAHDAWVAHAGQRGILLRMRARARRR
jgi:AraC family transcriptional regulator